ncbi:DNA repair protein RecO [Aetokthonos hydrillicola Thurmond2011]|jgi:DNA repair protein RecO (recombination protein O)|uniref:DNA repair protein RecO n=2 Tax=Aetokthonos TaxID=1550243 RepID=A0AAP5IH41_9CYAN|nr:DNA repair protein RecO [Aetokthonos hydrillicola]MBW4585807.1 DNA repair protein RecO [Aetokthonos hydrillicola CCALA 1050]MDR9899310.1 DNA repair protein RecO [Aetokthonos hydrillicola Thurmond2011]
MTKTYKATGINLKTQGFGESDRLVTILTQEFGLIRVIAPGSRKHNSSLGGRSGMFVVNELLIAKGRSLDKITQAQTVKSYPGLAKNLGKLAASQYLAEIVLCQALSEQPQEDLYKLLNEHLNRLEALPNKDNESVLAHLTQGVFHLLSIAGLTPQVQVCCLTGRTLTPDFTDPHWQVGFSITAGGIVCLQALEELKKEREKNKVSESSPSSSTYRTIVHQQEIPVLSSRLNATELAILQQLSQSEIEQDTAKDSHWLSVEQILRFYAQYHFGRPIRSAALIDSFFAANHDATL